MSRAALEAALATARATVVSIEAALAQTEPEPDVLDLKATMAGYGVGRDALLAAAERGELELSRGPRQRILVDRSELERWLKSRPLQPRKRQSEPALDTIEQWDEQQERKLRSIAGGRS